MFSDSKTEYCEILPVWKEKRSTNEASMQSEPFVSKHVEFQVKFNEDKQIQTESIVKESTSFGSFDVNAVLFFLKSVEPIVEQELEKNLHSHAFDNYELDFEDEIVPIQIIHKLTFTGFPEEKHVTCLDLSWSSTGSVIAVGYGLKEHSSWCVHSVGICLWHLNRREFSESKPNRCIETTSCVTRLAFHPNKPNILASGNINGNIYLWDLNKDSDPLICSSKSDEEGHSDTITNLTWVLDRGRKQKQYKLLSAALDGRILIWQKKPRSFELELYKGFIIFVADRKNVSALQTKSNRFKLGITNLSMNHEDPSLFVIGTEGGGIFQCTLDSEIHSGESILDLPLYSPVVSKFEPHKGHINAIACSPFNRNAFATCGSDGELRIYSLLVPGAPVMTIHTDSTLIAIRWSVVRPLVITVATDCGQLLFFDLNESNKKPSISVPPSSEASGFGICSLRFNTTDYGLLASGSEDGKVNIYKLGKQYSTMGFHETEQLRKLLTFIG